MIVLTNRIGDSEGVGDVFDAQAIMSANEETAKQEKQEQEEQQQQQEQQQETRETHKADETQTTTPDAQEAHAEEQQRPSSADGSDKDTVCPSPCQQLLRDWTGGVNSNATRLPTHTDCATSICRKPLRMLSSAGLCGH